VAGGAAAADKRLDLLEIIDGGMGLGKTEGQSEKEE
jgi:hypothetical protein